MDAGKRVLAWLSDTRNHGPWFTQGGKFTENLIAWVDKPEPTSLAQSYTDANWGPQDASHPREDVEELIDVSLVRSLLNHVVNSRTASHTSSARAPCAPLHAH
jgi:hypothetical protein